MNYKITFTHEGVRMAVYNIPVIVLPETSYSSMKD